MSVEEALAPYQHWCCTHIDPQINGLLLNWYDGRTGHYIGAHRDDSRDLVHGSSIVTISMGEERVFRMRPWKQRGFKDLVLQSGDVIVIPWETNQHWTHEVPAFKKYQGKRISLTFRAFKG